MTSVEVALIGFDSLLNVLRWVELGLLLLLVIILFANHKKLASKRPACAALIITIVATPILIFQFISHTIEPLPPEEPTPVNPIPHKDPEPEPLPEPDDEPISYIVPVVPAAPSKKSEKPSKPEEEKREERNNEEEKKDEGESDPETPDVPVVPDDTVAYLVVNRKMDIEGEDYEVDEVEEFDGYAGDVVTAKVKDYEGFTAPAEKTFTLNEDERKMVIYDYGRNKYDFVLGDEENTVSSVPTGNYYYGTQISLSAKSRIGYDFVGWSNGETDTDISLMLRSDTEITPNYEKGPNSLYKVIHKRQTMNGDYDDESLIETETLEAETESHVVVATKNYPGFKAPTPEEITVLVDDSVIVTYLYERESYDLTLNNVARIDYKTHDSGNYYYGTEITVRADRVNPGKVFKQWNNGATTLEYSFTLTSDTVLEPVYEDAEDMPTVFKIDGECQFNGIMPSNPTSKHMSETDPITGDGCADSHENFVGQNAINTHVKLFSEENINKDFVVSFDIVEFDSSKNAYRPTLLGSTLELAYDENNNKIQWPGIAVRRDDSNERFMIGSNTTYWKNANSAVRGNGTKKYTDNIADVKRMTMVRKQGTICYAVKNDYSDGYGQMIKMNKQDATRAYAFDLELYFGASYEDEDSDGEWSTTKYANAKLKNLEVRIGTDTADELASCR